MGSLWERACSRLGRVSICFECDTVIASRLAPTGIGFDHQTAFGQALQNGGYLKAKRQPLAAV